ncbi:MAGa4850 family ICE element protein [Mycoplasma tauri]|uniref:MAGa4850 family ICE element protein n=1 Tax=Mycoplasma tauri TaxID=547987 RepID=UPI001CBF73AA|nr:hypothetical protein [Mycoplasma tauri]MBZ4227003.1 hypothetical protein [Mycoplasma tauri]
MGAFKKLLIETEWYNNEANEYERLLYRRDLLFWKNYQNKKYDVLNRKGLNIILSSKISFSEKIFKLLKGNKVAFELLVILKACGARKAPYEINLLKSFGFKKSSIYFGLKLLTKIGLIHCQNGYVKLSNTKWKKHDEKYIEIKSKKQWYFFLLYGLTYVWNISTLYSINKLKNRRKSYKKFSAEFDDENSYCKSKWYKEAVPLFKRNKFLKFVWKWNERKVYARNKKVHLIHNSLFMGSRSLIYRFLKRFAEFVNVSFKSLFSIKRIFKNLEFKTLRYIDFKKMIA